MQEVRLLSPLSERLEQGWFDSWPWFPNAMRSKDHLHIGKGRGRVFMGAVAQPIKFTAVVGRRGWSPSLRTQRCVLVPAPFSWVSAQQPPSSPALLPSCIHDVGRDLVNKQASVLSIIIQRLSFPSSNPVTGITRQHCDVLFSMRCLS